jgi:tetratricopeptide (TPR) repeat protein
VSASLTDPGKGRFDRLVFTPDDKVQAVSEEGEVLWERETVVSGFETARVDRSGEPRVVGIFLRDQELRPENTRVLHVVDPASGQDLDRVTLPSRAAAFPAFADRFAPELQVVDLDGDGIDEILVSYQHRPYWPSYTVLYEPALRRSRVVFTGSGHHRPVGFRDLDGDGRPELVFQGINDRMGYQGAVAAVALVPWVGEASGVVRQSASSPDREVTFFAKEALLWYALLPRICLSWKEACLRTDDEGRRLVFRGTDGRWDVDLTFAGFDPAVRSAIAPMERQERRRRAYDLLREARRLDRAGLPDDALPALAQAGRLAEEVGDPRLAAWIGQVEAIALVHAGRLAEADRRFAGLRQTAESEADLPYEAGHAFHVAGDLGRAEAWYRRGLEGQTGIVYGRPRYELLEGLVLALGEQGEWARARSEVSRYTEVYPADDVRYLSWFVQWRCGDGEGAERILTLPLNSPDLYGYWSLESRMQAGEDPAALLRAVREERTRVSESGPLLRGLEGRLLARLGRTDEALEVLRQALQEAQEAAVESPAVRVHLPLMARRLREVASAAGSAADLEETRRVLGERGEEAGPRAR